MQVLNEYEKVHCLVRKDVREVLASKDSKISKSKRPVVDNSVHYLMPHTSSATHNTTKRRNDGTHEIPMEKRLENLTLNKLDSTSKVSFVCLELE